MPTRSIPAGAHPLDVIPLFRRWPASPSRNLVYTAIWSSLIGVLLAVVTCAFIGTSRPLPRMLAYMIVTSNVVGFLIHGALALLRLAAPAAFARGAWPMQVCKVLLMACCAVFGIALPDALLRGANPFAALLRDGALAPLLPFGVVTALMMVVVLATGERRLARATEAARQQEQIAEAARLLAEAKLRTLQAQIEPHFLYNTLANVVSLIGADPARARHMLERLIDFLRASLSASRAEHATLQGEVELARAYLDLLTVRMGARLRYVIDVDPACRDAVIAPMLIQPLVENAVMHGIEPKVDGGTIVVRARRRDGGVCIEVADDGVGLVPAAPRPGGGVGMSNLRERLRTLHGNNAQVQLLENQDGGVTSRLVLPA